jgi:tRNA-dihydrouridine synthase B
VKLAVDIPVIANGDVFTGEDAARILSRTGADMAMIGRGAFGYPWLFGEAQARLRGLLPPKPPTLYERIDTAVGQFHSALAAKGERAACVEARKYFAWYLRCIPRSGRLRERISTIASARDVLELSAEIRSGSFPRGIRGGSGFES